MQKTRAKKHRLPLAAYRGEKSVAFTACIDERRRPFEIPEIAEANVDLLKEAAQKHGCRVKIYCFMPDHLHAVLRGTSSQANAKSAMDSFKSSSGYWLVHNAPGYRWQTEYYDHIIRNSEDAASQFRYIATNPVRAGLVDDLNAYSYTGSDYGAIHELLMDLHFDRQFGRIR